MAEAIRDEERIDLIKAYTNDIIQYAEHAAKIVRELSAYSRAQRTDARSAVDMADVIENALRLARHSSSFASIELAAGLEKGSYVAANAGELQQVFVNLIINALHAMGDSGTLTVKCSTQSDTVVAMVSDTGCGIPDENLNQIYDPFYTTKPVGIGTGLGLYIVYKIVAKHGGTIDVESRVGRGAAFTLRFPHISAPVVEIS
jgi:signal transduction histidine kinase